MKNWERRKEIQTMCYSAHPGRFTTAWARQRSRGFVCHVFTPFFLLNYFCTLLPGRLKFYPGKTLSENHSYFMQVEADFFRKRKKQGRPMWHTPKVQHLLYVYTSKAVKIETQSNYVFTYRSLRWRQPKSIIQPLLSWRFNSAVPECWSLEFELLNTPAGCSSQNHFVKQLFTVLPRATYFISPTHNHNPAHLLPWQQALRQDLSLTENSCVPCSDCSLLGLHSSVPC